MLSPRRSAQIGLGSVILVLTACVAILLNGGASKRNSSEDSIEATPAAAIIQAADLGGSSEVGSGMAQAPAPRDASH